MVKSRAQCSITNPDLETWSGSPETATGWISINDIQRIFNSTPPLSVSKSTTSQSGTYAASLVLNSSITGKYSDLLYANKSCSQSPVSFSGHYTFTPSAGDSLLLFIAVSTSTLMQLSDTASANGYGSLLVSAASASYTSFTVPVVYKNNNPNSYISLGALIVKHTTATSALLDNFSITYPVTAVEEASANNQLNMITDLNNQQLIFSNINEKATVELYNMSGMKVSEKSVSENDASMDISSFRPGIYLVKVSVNNKQTTLKFIK